MRKRRQLLTFFDYRAALFHFAGFWKSPGVMLGKKQLIIGQHVELTETAFRDLNLFPEAGFQ